MCAIIEERWTQRQRKNRNQKAYMIFRNKGSLTEPDLFTIVGRHQCPVHTWITADGYEHIIGWKPQPFMEMNKCTTGMFHCSPNIKMLEHSLENGEWYSCMYMEGYEIWEVTIPANAIVLKGKNYGCSKMLDGKPVLLSSIIRINKAVRLSQPILLKEKNRRNIYNIE